MSAPKDPTPMVAAAFTASLLLHAGALSLFAAADPRSTSLSLASRRTVETQLVLPPDAAPKAPAPEQQPALPPPPPSQEEQPKPPPPQTEPDEVIAGIDDGIANTPAWLGFREATEHGGPKGVVEQSALSPEPGLPLPPGSPDPGQMDAPPLPPTPPSPPSEEPPAQPIKPTDTPPPQELPAETVKPPEAPPQEPPAEEKPQPQTPPSPEQPVDQPVAPEQPDPEKTPAPLPEPQPAADQQPALIGPPQPAPDDDAAQTLEHATEGRDLATNAHSPDPKSSAIPAAPEPDAVTQAQPDGILPLAADAQKQQPAEAAPKPIAPALAVPPAEVAPTLPTPPAPTPPRPKPRPAISPSAMLGVPSPRTRGCASPPSARSGASPPD